VEALLFRDQYRNANTATPLLIGCFGAEARPMGAVIALADFRPRTFLICGLFYFVAEMFTGWMLLDFAENFGFWRVES
jgi:hypothetical protein